MDLKNLYISPLETCNLNCQFCYTHKTKNILSNDQILKFISNFPSLTSITLCGGEVFTLPDFPALVNQLLAQKIFVTIITNGTIDHLDKINDSNNCQLLVSLDGPKVIHDANRGQGNFDKTIKFVRHALDLKFPTEIFFLITKNSYPFIDSFDVFGLPKTYLTDRLGSLSTDEIIDIKQNYPTFPSPQFGCSTVSLQSDGLIYGCCESNKIIGKISDDPQIILNNFSKSLNTCQNCKKCLGCCDPTYLCGYIQELKCHSCQEVLQKYAIR